MCRKFLLVISFVITAGLIGTARAATPIDVNNGSFEKDVNGVQITTSRWMGDVGGWTLRDTTGWAGGWWYVSDDDWGIPGYEAADGTVSSINVTGYDPCDANHVCKIYQILEDPEAVIAANRRYTLTFNAIRTTNTETPIALGELFYSTGEGEANDVLLAYESRLLTAPTFGIGYEGWEEISITCAIPSGSPAIGESLGVKLSNPYPWISGYPVAMDNVQVEWEYATSAFNPDPEDGEDNVARTQVLTWSPGEFVADSNGHQVYLGTDETAVENADTSDTTGIYRGPQTAASYDAPEHPFALGGTYYWRVDEVNDAYSGTDPPAGPWKGNVWSFTVTGYASNPSPVSGAIDVDPEPVLSWTAGTDATAHDVYLGTDAAAVANATPTTAGIFIGTQNMPDVDYAPAFLTLSATYYWRIDAKNAAGTLKGDIWQFTVNDFELIDDFESYSNDDAIKAAWNDYWYGPGHTNHGLVFKNTDTAFSRDGNSMKFTYENATKHSGKYYGSWATGLETKLPVGPNWTADGIKAITLYFYGNAANSKTTGDRMYVRLEDTAAHTGVLRLPDMNDVQEESWHEWNIQLSDAAFSSVVKTNISTIRIGFGGADGGSATAGGPGTMYFDDIRLYPTRCRPELAQPYGDIGNDDCTIDTADLLIMADDWAKRGVWADAAPPSSPPEVWYRFDEGSGTDTNNSGSWGSEYDITFPGGTADPAWSTDVKPPLDPCDPNSSLSFVGGISGGDYLSKANPSGNKFVGTQNMSITVWVKPATDMGEWDWPALVESRKDSDSAYATGFGFGGWGELLYYWNNVYWDWHTDLWVPTGVWSFAAVTVEPTKAIIYLSDGATMDLATHTAAHATLVDWDTGYTEFIAANTSRYPADPYSTFNGKIDDVRIYNKTLTLGEVMGLAGVSGQVYVPLVSDADLVVGNKNPTYPNVNDQIDFVDFAKLAESWLDTYLWP